MNRESWLDSALENMRPWFDNYGFPLPEKIMVSCGWPQHRGGKARAIGQCFDPVWTHDGTAHIFICPTLDTGIGVLAVLLHELCHAAVGVTAGHSGPFVRIIRLLGLEGKATHTVCRTGTPLYADLVGLEAVLGDYPHSPMKKQKMAPTRPPGGGWVKFRSTVLGDRYILRVSPKSLADFGEPTDPFGYEMETCP